MNDKRHQGSEIAPVIAAIAAVAGIFVTVFSTVYQHKSEELKGKRASREDFMYFVDKLQYDALQGKSPSTLEGDYTAGLLPYHKLDIYLSSAAQETIRSNWQTISHAKISFPGSPEERSTITNAYHIIELTLSSELQIYAK